MLAGSPSLGCSRDSAGFAGGIPKSAAIDVSVKLAPDADKWERLKDDLLNAGVLGVSTAGGSIGVGGVTGGLAAYLSHKLGGGPTSNILSGLGGFALGATVSLPMANAIAHMVWDKKRKQREEQGV